jgi:hypothetical protein
MFELQFRRTIVIVALVLAMVGGPRIATSGDVMVHNPYVRGNEYVKLEEGDRATYIAGLVDGILLSPFFGAQRNKVEWFERCTIERMTIHQVTAIVDKFMKENPNRWHESMHTLAYFAIKKACENDSKL